MLETWTADSGGLLTEFVAFALTLLASLILYWLRPRVKLIWGLKNSFLHRVPHNEGVINVSTSNYVVQNLGRKPAPNVDVVLNYSPDEVSVWPQRQYHEARNPEGRHIVTIQNIAPREAVDINLVTIGAVLPEVLSVHSPDATASGVEIVYNRRFGKLFIGMLLVLLFLGAMFVVSIIVHLFFALSTIQ